jgi:tetratricopeptide (TPR) repeat protein
LDWGSNATQSGVAAAALQMLRITMKRFVTSMVACYILLPALLRAEDSIEFYDRKSGSKQTVKGQIQSETIQGIKIKPVKDPERQIPGADILEVTYSPPGNLTSPEMRRPFNHEAEIAKATKPEDRAKKIDECLKEYRALIPKLETAKNTQAYMQYRMALMLVRAAETDPARAEDARNALTEFKDANPSSWEYPSVMQMLARIQEGQGKLEDARKTFEELAGRNELPAELRGQANFALVRMLLRAGQAGPAEARIAELVKLIPKDSPDSLRLQIYQIEIQIKKGQPGDSDKQLKAILAGPNDDVKGHASNVLAAFFQAKNQPEDAMWQYLWVDVLYNKDPEEHARALYHLTKLFKEVKGDQANAKKLLEKLHEPQFAGSEYQRMADKQK